METNLKPEERPLAHEQESYWKPTPSGPPVPPPPPPGFINVQPPTYSHTRVPQSTRRDGWLGRCLKISEKTMNLIAVIACVFSGIMSVIWYLTTLFGVQTVLSDREDLHNGDWIASVVLTTVGAALMTVGCTVAAISVGKGYRAGYVTWTVGMPIVAILMMIGLVLSLVVHIRIGWYDNLGAFISFPVMLFLSLVLWMIACVPTVVLLFIFTFTKYGIRQYEKSSLNT